MHLFEISCKKFIHMLFSFVCLKVGIFVSWTNWLLVYPVAYLYFQSLEIDFFLVIYIGYMLLRSVCFAVLSNLQIIPFLDSVFHNVIDMICQVSIFF